MFRSLRPLPSFGGAPAGWALDGGRRAGCSFEVKLTYQNGVHFSIKSSQPCVQCSQYCARPAKTADCGLVQPCPTQDHEWKKAGAGSFVGDIGLLVIIIGANYNKTEPVPALVAASIAAGAWWVVLC